MAALSGAKECLALLLKNGGDLAAETSRRLSVMDIIFDHIPRPIAFLTEMLDRSIVPNEHSINSPSFKVSMGNKGRKE